MSQRKPSKCMEQKIEPQDLTVLEGMEEASERNEATKFSAIASRMKAVFQPQTSVCKNRDSGLGGVGVACCPYVPKFAGSNPTEAVRIFQGKKILSVPSFGGEVKPSVPLCRFGACKRSLK